MYSDRDLATEVKKLIEAALDTGRISRPEWIVHSILQNHPLSKEEHWAAQEHRQFYWLAAGSHVRAEVNRLLRETKSKIDLGKWSRQPGFAFIQKGYMIERRGQQRLVPLGKMTRGDAIQKIQELFAMSEGAIAHARELMRYFRISDPDLKPRAA
jgi:hypothetical protein